jgi:hypothetical protein
VATLRVDVMIGSMTRRARLCVVAAVLSVPVSACAHSSVHSKLEPWALVRFESSALSVPAGWSVEFMEGSRESPLRFWFWAPVPHSKPVLVASWPPEPVSEREMRADLKDLLMQMGAPRGDVVDTVVTVVHSAGRVVYCAERSAASVYVVCLAAATGRPSSTQLIWFGANEGELRAIGGIEMLAGLAARVENLPYRERRYE